MVAQAGKLNRRRRGLFAQLIIPRIEDVLFLAIFVSVIGLGSRLLNMDGDLGRHLTIGNYILNSVSIPTRDIFSHTMEGFPLTPHEWLAQMVFSISYRIAGLDGVVILCALVIATTFTLVYRQCFKQSNMLLISILMTVLAAGAASVHWLTRPHIFTLLFTVLWIGVLENFRRTGRIRLWSLPILMIVWVNFHGAFIAGFVIWGIYLINSLLMKVKDDELLMHEGSAVHRPMGLSETRTLMIIGSLALCGTLINPVGWRIWETTIGFLGNNYLVGHTVEYLPPDFHQVNFWPFLLMISISILFLAGHRKRLSITAALLITVWTAAGLISARNISIYAVVSAPILAGIISAMFNGNLKFDPLTKLDSRLRSINVTLFGYLWPLVIVIVIVSLYLSGVKLDFNRNGNQFLSSNFPVSAADWVLEQENMGPVFNYFPWGGYLLYRMWPEEQVFIDGQTDFYGEEITRQYERVITLSEGWQGVLMQYQVQWVIMPTESRLVKALLKEAEWKMNYQDGTATILTRSN